MKKINKIQDELSLILSLMTLISFGLMMTSMIIWSSFKVILVTTMICLTYHIFKLLNRYLWIRNIVCGILSIIISYLISYT